MQLGAPLEASAPAGDGESTRRTVPSRRATLALGVAVALAIVAGARYVGGRQGFDQIGRGGMNRSLLPKVGQAAPDFATVLSDGRLARLSDFRGRPVWLNFWGSWCPPCRAEMPEIQSAYAEELGPRGMVWLAVSLDEPAKDAAEFAALNRTTFLIASDPYRTDTGGAYPITNFPTHVLIDRDGIVRDVVLAAIDRDEIVERAEQLLPNQG